MDHSWKEALAEEFGKKYFTDLSAFLERAYATQDIYPAKENLFRALTLTPFNDVKVVVLGQDPYHGAGQSIGLAFATAPETRIPPSLRNIYSEIEQDCGISMESATGDLSRWARQGVLLLNAALTVQAGLPGSHRGRGWEMFTDAILKTLSDRREHLVFMLWGNSARAKGDRIDRDKHLVIESVHPSPLSARNGFFGSKPFSKANHYLKRYGESPIDWR